MAAQVILLDDLAHVAKDLLSRGNRLSAPRLEAIAEGVQVAVRADARIPVGDPGAAEAVLQFQHHEAGSGTLLRQVVGAADTGNPGPDNEDIKVFRSCRDGFG